MQARCLVCSIALLTGCVYLPRPVEVTPSFALPAQDRDRIHLARAAGDPAEVRARLLEDPADALAARVATVRAADRTVDAQYYTWKRDVSGHLMIRELMDAADRGVRVRVLVDDVHMAGLVSRVAAINEHPNIEIRIFNPFSTRFQFDLGLFRLVEFAIDGNRLNHRMHNKSLIADNQLAIVGGRNIGNDYFGLDEKLNFLDLDVLLSGEIVPAISAGFDAYWNSNWAYPAEAFPNLLSPSLAKVRGTIERSIESYGSLLPEDADVDWQRSLQNLANASRVAEFAVLYDTPVVRWFEQPTEMADNLLAHAEDVSEEVLVVTPYLIPTPRLMATARELVEKGVRVRVVTNSLASNDLVIAHAGYARFRRRLLETGVELYELRGDAAIGHLPNEDISPKASLHSKFIVFDADLVYIGSLNLDPRSVEINTELGVVLKSAQLADQLRDSFATLSHADNAWRVTMADAEMQWRSSAGVVRKQPASGFWQRALGFLFSFLPLSGQL